MAIHPVSVDDIVEAAIGELHDLDHAFFNLWEQYQNWDHKAINAGYTYDEILVQFTMYRLMLSHITEKLDAAYGMGEPHFLEEMRVLLAENHREGAEQWL